VWQPYVAKQTILLISVLSVYTSIATSWCRSEYLLWGRQGWSSSILERKLTAHTTAISSSKRVCCLTSEQYVVCILQKDGAPAHTARTTMDYLKKEHINFIESHMWPPNSHDINPVDYAIWGALQQRVYHQRQFKTVEELQRAIVTEWQKLSQHFIDYSINEWRRRLKAVIKNVGGHIEHCNLAWAAAHHVNTIER